MPVTLPSPLRGIIVPLVTPLAAHDQLDSTALGRLIEHVIAGGVHGIFILGTTGEGPSLSYRLRRELIAQAAKTTAGRVPLLVGISDTSAAEALALAHFSAEAGAQAVVLAPPYYFRPNQAELLAYCGHVAAGSPLPVVLYNTPGHSGVSFAVETIQQAAEIENIVGLKDSSGQMVYFHQVRAALADRPEFTLLVGPEELLAETVLLGGHGGVNGGANLFPKLYVALYNAALAGQAERARELHQRVMRISRELYSAPFPGWIYLHGLKGALAAAGLCSALLEVPLKSAASDQNIQISSIYSNISAALTVL